MVNLFCAPMKSMSTSIRIEKALDRLRQTYGVSGGLTFEPKVRAIRHGAKVVFNSSSLKMYNEDLNALEVFAYAHDEVEKLSVQLLLDTAVRLPDTLKRRYLDFLDKKGLNLSRPGLESLRSFVVHEIDMMTSDYAQAFFKGDKLTRGQRSFFKIDPFFKVDPRSKVEDNYPKSKVGSISGVRRIFQWGVSVTSRRDDVKILQLAYSSSEVLKCIGL